MTNRKPPKMDSTEDLPSEEKIKMLIAGARYHVKIVLDTRVERSKAITSTLIDQNRWELESLIMEITKFQFLYDMLGVIIRFL